MVDWKKDTWMYILIAAILALISIFTPVASTDALGGTTQIFFSGQIYYNGDFDPEWFGAGTATIWTLAITSMCIALLLFYGLHGMKGMEFKWDWLVFLLIGIALIIFPILMMVYDLEHPIYGDLDIGFAGIGILISGIICVVVFVLEKFMGD